MGKRKIIAIASSDWHLHNWNNFNENDMRIRSDLLQVQEIHSIASKLNVPILFTGDMFHNDQSLSNKLLHYTLPVFNSLFNGDPHGVHLYGIDGNHDQVQQNTPENLSPSYLQTLSQVFSKIHCLNFQSKSVKKFKLHGIPYITRNQDFDKIVRSIKLSKKKKNILMIHTDLPESRDTNGRVIGSTRNIPDRLADLFSRFDLVISGHIHKPQIMDTNVLMIGAPKHQRKTDIGCPMGYWEIYNDMSFKFKQHKKGLFPEFKLVDKIPDDKDNFYIIEKKKLSKLKEAEHRNKRDFNALMSRKKLVNNYCKEVGDITKKQKQTLKNFLDNA